MSVKGLVPPCEEADGQGVSSAVRRVRGVARVMEGAPSLSQEVFGAPQAQPVYVVRKAALALATVSVCALTESWYVIDCSNKNLEP